MKRLIAVVSLCVVAAVVVTGLALKRDNTRGGPPAHGSFVVSVRADGRWREVGQLDYRHQLRARALDLGSADSGNVSVRIVKRGGGAAHIDRVALGGMPAATASVDLAKIAERDHDVVDASDGFVEFAFETGDSRPEFELVARIEPHDIPKEPFQFPRANLFREVDARSAFYTYEAGSRRGALKVDGSLAGESLGEPLFSEFEPCVSGHPNGTTYGWVMDDGETLYAAIDFTPDNTMDGNKDWAKIFVRVEDGVREFKVSAADLEWGRPGFTYTDRVGYQHKVYEFEIPLREIAPRPGPGIQLAFAAYGTASAGRPGSVSDLDPINGTYMMVWSAFTDAPNDNDIYAAVYDLDGTVLTAEFVAAQTMESETYMGIAADTVTGGFLVAWLESGTGNPIIRGQRFTSDGTATGSLITISDDIAGNKYGATVAFDPVNTQWLVAWEDFRSSNGEVLGRIVDADGTVTGSDFDVRGSAGSGQPVPHLAYDTLGGRYLLTWQLPSIGARFVTSAGAGTGSIISLTAGGSQEPNSAGDEDTGMFLVVWSSSGDIIGDLVNPDGSIAVAAIDISSAVGNETGASVAADPDRDRFLVTWADTSDNNIYGRFVTDAGATDGAAFQITFGSTTDDLPNVSVNPGRHDFGVTYLADGSAAIAITGRKAVTATPETGLVTSESGATDTFDVVLDMAPSATVTVAVASLDTAEATVGPATLTFTTADWFTPQTVTVTGVADGTLDADQAFTITLTPGGSDGEYVALGAYTVIGTNDNVDQPPSSSDDGCTPGGNGSPAALLMLAAAVAAFARRMSTRASAA